MIRRNSQAVVQNCHILSRVTTGNSALDASVPSTSLCGIVRRHRLLVWRGYKIFESLSEVSSERHASAKIQVDRTSDVSSCFGVVASTGDSGIFTLLIELGHWEETSDVSSSFSSREASRAQSSLEHPPTSIPLRSCSKQVQESELSTGRDPAI